ncbi:MAG TPA: AsmA family protein [Dongiaceae bacterium]|nr:AsmA family protein [Dongiaceae bacterium]
MKILSSKRRIAVAAGLLLLALFLFRPGASRLKSRIITSLSSAVGRPVDLGSAHIRLLPRPGFDLENLVVYDDPAFGSEPILRASEVTADLRLTSLLRGRLEVARLDLSEPSLNLVHHAGGGWNLESLLEHTARTPLAPTGKMRSEPRPGFPYIEGSSARINFKNGPEKKSYALTNADFALWQDSENAWSVRLKAEPFRSDMNLNDTGLLQVSGTWQRSASFRETPMQFSVEWMRAQLGQVTKFFTGNDQGWRGAILLDATITGTPAALKILSTVSVDDFRRYDITTGTSLRLAARCSGEYSTHTREFSGVECAAPVSAGLLTLKGHAGLPGSHRYDISVTAEKLPAAALAALAQRVKKNIGQDLSVEGSLQGTFSASHDPDSGLGPRFEGQGRITDFRASSTSLKVEIAEESIPFAVIHADRKPVARGNAQERDETRLEIGPFSLEKAHAGAATVRALADRRGYLFTVSGEAEVGRVLRIARLFGVPALNSAAEGAAQLNLQIAGAWTRQNATQGFLGPQITGSAKLRNLRFGLRGIGEPVEVLSAEMQLTPVEVRVDKIVAKAAGSTWKGSVELPRGCGVPEACAIHFALNTDEITMEEANAWASNARNRPWYQVLGVAQTGPSLLARLNASGRFTADRVELRSFGANRVSANVGLDSGNVEISALKADFLGGKHLGKWQMNFTSKPAMCSGSGNLVGVSLGNLLKLTKDDWVTGTAGASYEMKGSCGADFWQSSEGTVQLGMADGVLSHLFLGNSSEALKVRKFSGQLRWTAGKLEVSNANLESPEGKYEVSGTATFKRQIDFKIARLSAGAEGTSYSVTGTLAEPRVATFSGAEQARLKTLSSK